MVEEVTDDKSLEKGVRKSSCKWTTRPNTSQKAKTVKLAQEIANVQDVTNAPPANWDLARRIACLDWTEEVVAGCRETNAPLEKLYDEVLEMGRAKFRSWPRRSPSWVNDATDPSSSNRNVGRRHQ